MRMFLMVFLLFALYCGVLFRIWYKFKQPSYGYVDRLYKEFPNCEFVILYGAVKLKRPYGFTFEPNRRCLIVDMESPQSLPQASRAYDSFHWGLTRFMSSSWIDYIKGETQCPSIATSKFWLTISVPYWNRRRTYYRPARPRYEHLRS